MNQLLTFILCLKPWTSLNWRKQVLSVLVMSQRWWWEHHRCICAATVSSQRAWGQGLPALRWRRKWKTLKNYHLNILTVSIVEFSIAYSILLANEIAVPLEKSIYVHIVPYICLLAQYTGWDIILPCWHLCRNSRMMHNTKFILAPLVLYVEKMIWLVCY